MIKTTVINNGLKNLWQNRSYCIGSEIVWIALTTIFRDRMYVSLFPGIWENWCHKKNLAIAGANSSEHCLRTIAGISSV